jgi:4-hydroxybenzoyl-CoA thioesterase
MARIKIDLPETFIFQTEVPIYISHINYGNHLDNAALLTLVSEARMRFFKHLGFSEGDIEGTGIIVADAAIQYRAEAFYGETLIFEMTVSDIARVGCDLVYRVTKQESQQEVARGKTGIVFFDYAAREPVPIPEGFLRKLERTGH